MVALATRFLVSVEEGAENSIYAASSPDLDGVSGRYLMRRRERSPSRQACDVEAQKRLRDESVRLAGIA